MKTTLLFAFLSLSFFAQAQPSMASNDLKRHEIIAATWAYTPLAVFMSEYYDWQVGYRYHLNSRFALRASYQTHGFTGRFTSSKSAKNIWEVKLPKIGAQYALSSNPFHAFVSVGVGTPIYNGQSNGNNYLSGISTNLIGTVNGVGFAWGVGVGMEYVLNNRFSFALFTEPMFSNIPLSNGKSGADGSPTTEVNKDVFGDILSFSFGFCF